MGHGCVILALLGNVRPPGVSDLEKDQRLKAPFFPRIYAEKDNVFSAVRASGVFGNRTDRVRPPSGRPHRYLKNFTSGAKSSPLKAREAASHFYWKLRTLYEQYRP